MVPFRMRVLCALCMSATDRARASIAAARPPEIPASLRLACCLPLAACRVQLQHGRPAQHAERHHHHQQTPCKRPGSQAGHLPRTCTGEPPVGSQLALPHTCMCIRVPCCQSVSECHKDTACKGEPTRGSLGKQDLLNSYFQSATVCCCPACATRHTQQSTKLCIHEERVLELVLETKHMPQAMAEHGTVNVTSEEVAQRIGQVFIQRVRTEGATPARPRRCGLPVHAKQQAYVVQQLVARALCAAEFLCGMSLYVLLLLRWPACRLLSTSWAVCWTLQSFSGVRQTSCR